MENATKEFEVDAHGIIRTPGKFEGETLATVHFYDAMMDGGGDETLYYAGTAHEVFKITPDEIEMYPELTGSEYAVLHESEQGFAYLDTCNQEDLDKFRAECEESEEDNDDMPY